MLAGANAKVFVDGKLVMEGYVTEAETIYSGKYSSYPITIMTVNGIASNHLEPEQEEKEEQPDTCTCKTLLNGHEFGCRKA
jgi:hypothetical protein